MVDDDDLHELAEAFGVSTSYRGAGQERLPVDRPVLRAVLEQFGLDTSSAAAVRGELAEVRRRRCAGVLPETVVLSGRQAVALPRAGVVHCEGGQEIPVNGRARADRLPFGVHRLETEDQRVLLLVTPRGVPTPLPAWGWTVQLHALRSGKSWGMGDFGDLSSFVGWCGELGAGAVLLNPVHAVTPVSPVERSPHSPSSRQFLNPLYLRVEDTAAYRHAPAEIREVVDELRPSGGELVDHDETWQAKLAALELLWSHASPPDGPPRPELARFATFCALAERHGADWRRWPARLRHPDSPAVAQQAARLAPRVAFHAWLQRLCAEQVAKARDSADLAVGLIGDLAAGVAPSGADAWASQDVLALGTTIGAAPGEDWGVPPWRPDRLAAAGFAPFRDVLRGVLRHADGIRVGHVAGLWRQWWIPPGEAPQRGTYVRYDAEAMLGVLALEAHRAGAVVVGEDQGEEPEVTRALHDRGMLSSAALWSRQGCRPLPPDRWPAQAVATLSAHDLPTATGFLRAEHVRVRAELGLLELPAGQERARARLDRDELVDLLLAEGLVDEDAGEQEVVVAMHELLARTPCRLLLVAPEDLLGETRQAGFPGSAGEYPNWRIPLPVPLEELRDAPVVRVAVQPLRRARPPLG
ncbi:4-alpha-glucanotransferase [Lentzea sp. CC55]|uniref:4-alpha-glucanotransferase n=1 Tax=Lentzea sp. CC55 TaxID=2884909 RepID=UPI0027DF86BA|nr:4-alpha-glucanotransferase [Lentzea sp. CC55]MCG8923026.1 4-alpha-glucanotransferase [Lentzea sp. CC55]